MDLSNYKEEKLHYIKRLVWMMLNVTLFRIAIGRVSVILVHSLSIIGIKLADFTHISQVMTGKKLYISYNDGK